MDGGFFLCPDAWEFLLPAEICHLRNAMAVCRKRWDLLTLTPMGCALLPEPAAVTAGILLLPGDCPRSDLRAGTVVTYGLSPRDSITLSSLREPVLCVQRTLPLLCGGSNTPPHSSGSVRRTAADAAAAVRRRIGATGISPAGGRGGGASAARCGDPAAVDRLALSSVRNGAFTGSFWRRPVRSTRKPPWLQAASV